MSFSPYQIIVPLLSLAAVFYAYSLLRRGKKTLWEFLLWVLFWGAISSIAVYPGLLSYLSLVTGIQSQVNAIIVTGIGVLFFMVFLLLVRLEELEQRHARLIREIALREMERDAQDSSSQKKKHSRSS